MKCVNCQEPIHLASWADVEEWHHGNRDEFIDLRWCMGTDHKPTGKMAKPPERSETGS